jgi:hypothetical protein
MGILFDFMPSTGQRARQRDSGRRFDDGAASYEMDCRFDIRMHVSKGSTAVGHAPGAAEPVRQRPRQLRNSEVGATEYQSIQGCSKPNSRPSYHFKINNLKTQNHYHSRGPRSF